ncbi:MAG: YjbQ family protein [Proteobacteria bacterium]|nr:YjbQ family protein [Pseudomonadota bacterium]
MWHGSFTAETGGRGEVLDLTGPVEAWIAEERIAEGHGALFVPGSTAGLTTLEYEPGVVRDLQECLERLAPAEVPYHHDRAWGDGNGYAHVRAALLGPSLAFLVRNGKLRRGTWQQLVLCDFDNRPRRRSVEVQVIGRVADR